MLRLPEQNPSFQWKNENIVLLFPKLFLIIGVQPDEIPKLDYNDTRSQRICLGNDLEVHEDALIRCSPMLHGDHQP